jgi:drug/metabolite transporter (DMT)-like permease
LKLVTSKTILPYLWMLLGSLSFASMATLAYALRSHCDWQLIALARASLACFFALLLAWAAGAPLVLWRPPILWARSIAGSISMICTFYALTKLPTSDVLTLGNMFPIWVALLSWPLLNEVPSGGVWLSVVSGVIGVALIQQPRFTDGNFAALVALAGSVTTAFAMIGLHQLYFLDLRAVVAHFSGVASLFCLASFFLFERHHSLDNTLEGTPLVLLLGVGITATIGQLCLTKAFTAGPPAKVSVVGLTQIVFAMGFDLILWRHSFSPLTLLGIVLVVGPTAWLLTQRGEPIDESSKKDERHTEG